MSASLIDGDMVLYSDYPGTVFRVTHAEAGRIKVEYARGVHWGMITIPGSWWVIYPSHLSLAYPDYVQLPQGI